MADEGGVTLRIDANTAAYIAKISQLADSHEKVTKHVDEWGHAADHVIGRLAAMAAPLALIEGVVSNVEKGFEAWAKHLESAGKTTETLVDKLRRTTVNTGENRQAVEDQLLSVKSGMSVEQRVSGFDAFRKNAPGSATRVAPSEVARSLAKGQIAGYDTDQLAGIAGNVEGAAGGKSFDLAALLMARTGSNADQASGLIRRLTEKAGPQGAQAALPYLLASAQAGDRRFSMISEAENSYNPAFGDFGAYLQMKLKNAGPDKRGLAESIQRGLPGAQKDIANLGGYLDTKSSAALEDESVRTDMRIKYFKAQAEVENFQKRKETQEYYEERDAKHQLNAVEDPADAAIMPNIHDAGQYVTGNWRGEKEGNQALDSLSGEKSATKHLETISDHLEEQNAILRQKSLKPGAHDE